MPRENGGMFTPGNWGFQESWPPSALGPVFDIFHGDAHVARLYKAQEGWRLVLRSHHEISSDLDAFRYILDKIAKRMGAFESGAETVYD